KGGVKTAGGSGSPLNCITGGAPATEATALSPFPLASSIITATPAPGGNAAGAAAASCGVVALSAMAGVAISWPMGCHPKRITVDLLQALNALIAPAPGVPRNFSSLCGIGIGGPDVACWAGVGGVCGLAGSGAFAYQ